MAHTALITGASAGIGAAFAHYHAAKGGDLIITARRESTLVSLKNELEQAHGISVHVVAADLASADGPSQLIKAVEALKVNVDILINNAGFGGHGKHYQRDLNDELSMIDLNVKALVTLTHHFAQKMIANGGGKILQVGSTAGFLPGPNQAVYFATKNFVNAFSQAIDQEMRALGVTSTVLAPGYVETEFADVANLRGTQMVNRGGASAESVAKLGYDAMMKGQLIAINDPMLGILLRAVIPFLPTRLKLRIIEQGQGK